MSSMIFFILSHRCSLLHQNYLKFQTEVENGFLQDIIVSNSVDSLKTVIETFFGPDWKSFETKNSSFGGYL